MTHQPPITHRHHLDASHARSWLLVPADKPERFAEAFESAADAVILDLEDAVIASNKDKARAELTRWTRSGGRAWVRINDATTEHWNNDLAAIAALDNIEGVMLAKTETAEQVDATAQRLHPGTRVIALVETAAGMVAATSIAQSPATFRLAFGSGDYRRDTGMDQSPLAMAYPRSHLTAASRAAGLPGPIDGPTVSFRQSVLEDETTNAASLGATGRLCMRPEQTSTVNKLLSPTDHDVRWARKVIDTLGEDGERVNDGSDLPRLARARRITRLERLFAAYGLPSDLTSTS
ncbi:CoA ester lyase [Rhodococcus sp. TAF43]|uniref:HpcH/HpaI aldolase/citrate lyase family protein n=1 Tax=unclassified Rhodococcus (in: high G+C Gram-positive bacteria) TaxID=192944 RepID=UPI00158298FB|nr:CoA ester lyase [Rhodococcus sp. W8901]QKT13369.1 CoA ester lyase [Rhodococcus sp. W8901]